MLTISVSRLDDATVLRCEGRIVRGEETRLLCAAVRRTHERIMLDIEGVEAIDAAGVGLFIALQAAGVYITLLNPQTQVRRVLQLTGVDSVLEIRSKRHEEASGEDFAQSPSPVPVQLPLAG